MIAITDTEMVAVINLRKAEAELRTANKKIYDITYERALIRDERDQLRLKLAVEEAHAAGLLEQCRALRKECPNSELNQPSGHIASDGVSLLKLFFAAYVPAFDHKAKELGLENPEQYRPWPHPIPEN